MPPQWTLHPSGLSGGSHASKLVGCHFTNPTGNAYNFTENDPKKVLFTVGPPLPGSGELMTFGPFNYKGVDGWTVTAVAPLSPGVNFTGQWNTPATKKKGIEDTPAQSGTYTAQSDGTFEDPENVAASAKA